jgi:predicted amidophosphoribosyltransferase
MKVIDMFVRPWLKQFGRGMVDLIFPPSCCWCQKLSSESSDTPLGQPLVCQTCTAKFPAFPPHQCQRCSAIVGPYVDSTEGCSTCRDYRFHFDDVFSWNRYEGELSELCINMKFPQRELLIEWVSQQLQLQLLPRLSQWNADLVLGVPEYRMFGSPVSNHMPQQMARHIARMGKLREVNHLLVKQLQRPKQAFLSKTERKNNLDGAFRVTRPRQIAGKSIIVVDDILTTGSTVSEVAKTLKAAGATHVHIVVVARTTSMI